MEFKDKVVLVTGGGGGIGRKTLEFYAREGAICIVSDINEKGGQETLDIIHSLGAKGIFVKTDVAIFEDVRNLMEVIVSKYGRLDIAVNNAGIGGQPGKTEVADHKSWDQVIAINQTGVFYCMQLEIQQMIKQGNGAIVNTASIAGIRGLPNNLAYVASKHAVVGMTKTAAMEYARHNIRVNAICPVFTVTNLFNPEIMDSISQGLSEKLKQGIPMKRFASTNEMANTILWLSSDKASFITGQAIAVDGGLTA